MKPVATPSTHRIPSNMPDFDVFVSYRWTDPDQVWVRSSLYPALQAAGLRVLLDVEDFVPGRDLMLEMTRASQESRHLLCVLSPDYFNGARMVHFEALMARRGDPSGTQSRLIPLVLRTVEVPEWLRGLVPVDWTIPTYREREWRKLLVALNAPRQSPPPANDPLAGVTAATSPPIAPKTFAGPPLPPLLARAYTLRTRIATGSLSELFDATDSSGRRFLIKRIPNKSSYRKRAVEEIARIYRGGHAGGGAAVPQSIVEGGDGFYEVLDPIDGWTLSDVMTSPNQSGVIGRLLEQWAGEIL